VLFAATATSSAADAAAAGTAGAAGRAAAREGGKEGWFSSSVLSSCCVHCFYFTDISPQAGAAALTSHSGLCDGGSNKHQEHLLGTQRQESATILAEGGGGVNMQVLQSSVTTPSLTRGLSMSSSPASSSVSSTLEQIAKNGGQCQLNSSALHQPSSDLYQARPLVQLMGRSSNSTQHEQPASYASAIEDNAHIATVVISQPPDSLMTRPRSISSTILEPSSSSPASSNSPAPFSHHRDAGEEATFSPPRDAGQEGLRSQLETLATEQFITQQLPPELAENFTSSVPARGDREDASAMEMVEQSNLQFQHSSDSLAVGSVNPNLASVIFSTNKQCMVEDISDT